MSEPRITSTVPPFYLKVFMPEHKSYLEESLGKKADFSGFVGQAIRELEEQGHRVTFSITETYADVLNYPTGDEEWDIFT